MVDLIKLPKGSREIVLFWEESLILEKEQENLVFKRMNSIVNLTKFEKKKIFDIKYQIIGIRKLVFDGELSLNTFSNLCNIQIEEVEEIFKKIKLMCKC